MATVVDPVCGMQLDSASAPAQSQYQGQTYYFCSTSCQQQFEQDPQRYAGGQQSGMGAQTGDQVSGQPGQAGQMGDMPNQGGMGQPASQPMGTPGQGSMGDQPGQLGSAGEWDPNQSPPDSTSPGTDDRLRDAPDEMDLGQSGRPLAGQGAMGRGDDDRSDDLGAHDDMGNEGRLASGEDDEQMRRQQQP